MIQIATRFPVRSIRAAATLSVCVDGLWVHGSRSRLGRVGGHTRQSHGKFASRRWGRAPPIFWNRPAGWYVQKTGKQTRKPSVALNLREV